MADPSAKSVHEELDAYEAGNVEDNSLTVIITEPLPNQKLLNLSR